MLQHIRNWFLRSSLFIAVLLSVVIAIMSLISTTSLPTKHFIVSDKILHGFAYFMLMWSWLLVFRKDESIKLKFALWFILLVFGIILELFQGNMMQHRSADWKDVIANAAGLVLGLITFKYMYLALFGSKEH